MIMGYYGDNIISYTTYFITWQCTTVLRKSEKKKRKSLFFSLKRRIINNYASHPITDQKKQQIIDHTTVLFDETQQQPKLNAPVTKCQVFRYSPVWTGSKHLFPILLVHPFYYVDFMLSVVFGLVKSYMKLKLTSSYSSPAYLSMYIRASS